MTGKTAEKKLTNHIIAEISLKNMDMLGKGDVYTALKQIILSYRDVLDGRYVSSLKKQTLPKAEAIIGQHLSANAATSYPLLASVVLALVVALLH